MRRLSFIFVVMILLSSRLGSIQAQDDSLGESFDDPTLPGWEYSPGVSVVDGILRVPPGEFAFRGGRWSDLTLSVRARRTGDGYLTIQYLVTDTGVTSLASE
jgi:hypothetical protein